MSGWDSDDEDEDEDAIETPDAGDTYSGDDIVDEEEVEWPSCSPSCSC
jgi:hypothetical protein